MYKIILYETENGKQPVSDFLDSLEPKMRAKLSGLLVLLHEKGNSLREPYSAPVADGIYELRCILGNNITRALYFFYYGKQIVVTNGFVKKTQKTPKSEIITAKKRRADWIRRQIQESSLIRETGGEKYGV